MAQSKPETNDLTGLTEEETVVMNTLISAWESFGDLEGLTEGQRKDFSAGLHMCQDVLGRRILARIYPQTWR